MKRYDPVAVAVWAACAGIVCLWVFVLAVLAGEALA